MNKFLRSSNQLATGFLAVILLAVAWSPGAEAATRKVKCGKDDLQKVITAAVSGDTIEITGVCLGNFRIDRKDLTLMGASTAGPHGIQGVAADIAGLFISRSDKTSMQGLSFLNGADGGVLIDYSNVSMTDCTVSNNAGRGISVHQSSFFGGLRLQINDNASSGLVVINQSRADCVECALNGNSSYAAQSNFGSALTLWESVVSGKNGLYTGWHSWLDIDCSASFPATLDCSLHATQVALRAFEDSTVAIYAAGDFDGALMADGDSKVQLVGARQQSTGWKSETDHAPRSNSVSNGSSLRVDPWDNTVAGSSRLMGITNVSEFSHALLYADSAGGDSALVGALNCGSGGDAWMDAGVDLTAGSITGCDHAE
jgi:hypothetical protein